MIQPQGQDELIVGVPSAGPLLDHRSHLRACFGDLLASGHEETIEGRRCIVWHVEGQQRLSPADPRHSEAVARLSRGVARARQLAGELRKELEAQPQARDVQLGPEALELMGVPEGDGAGVRLPRGTVERLASAHDLAALAVDYALRNPVIFTDDHGMRLVGWGFLPPRVIPPRVPIPPTVALEFLGQQGGSWQFRWRTTGSARDVQLLRVVGSSVEPVERAEVDRDDAVGEWSVPMSALPWSAVVRAIASGAGGIARSGDVALPDQPVQEPSPPGPAVSGVDGGEPPPLPKNGFRATPIEEPPVVPQETLQPDEPRRSRWWLLPLALLLLLLLLLLAWLLFPGMAYAKQGSSPLVAPQVSDLPPRRSDEDRRRGVIDVTLPPPVRKRVLQYWHLPGERSP
jgi:hypothetical protein